MTNRSRKRKFNSTVFIEENEENSVGNPRPKKRVTFSPTLTTTATYLLESEEESDESDDYDWHTSWVNNLRKSLGFDEEYNEDDDPDYVDSDGGEDLEEDGSDLDPIHDIETLTNTALNSGVRVEEIPGGLTEVKENEKDENEGINGMDDVETEDGGTNGGLTKEDKRIKDGNEHEGMVNKSLSSIHKPPTNEEIQGLRETTDLFKSNIFKLQIDELLSEISIDFTKTSKLENTLNKLKQIFENMNDKLDLTVENAKSILFKKHDIVIPFPDPQPPDDIQYKFGFKRPTTFYLVGSYPLRSVIRGRYGFNVDVVVVMPQSIFQEKDYMNNRYFYKRAYYLAVLAAVLQDKSSGLDTEVKFDTLDGDRRRPIIRLKFTDGPNGDKKLSNEYSSYQLIKGTMDFLANHDFIKSPLFMNESEISEEGEFSKKLFTENFDVVFVDNSGTLNLFSEMSRTALEHLQFEARLAMKFFNESVEDRFEALFLKKVDDMKLRYDNVAKLAQLPETYSEYTNSVKLDYPDKFVYFARTIPHLLKRGLTDRVDLIAINYDKLPSWSTSESPRTYTSTKTKLYFGFVFNPEQSNRSVDYGPSPEDEKAAKEFQKLWGKKAEVRRFKDGRILECVVWEYKRIETRSLIVNKIVLYLLSLHFGIKDGKEGIRYFAGQLNKFVIPSPAVPKHIFDLDIVVKGFQPVMTAYYELTKQLLSLEDIPLRISSVKATSPELRYASVFVPQPHQQQKKPSRLRQYFLSRQNVQMSLQYIEPIEIQIQFESSTRWPNDLVAVQKMKLAFYINISEQLKAKLPDIKVSIVTNDHDVIISPKSYLDIFTASGFAFRCRIYYEREISMLKRVIEDKVSSPKKKEVFKNALEVDKRLFIDLPLHSSQIQTLCNKYPSLSLTIRLAKRWFMVHLLEAHVDEEFIEVLCAFVYLEPQPWSRPATGFVGFLRVLNIISTWDWKNEPMIVDLGENHRGDALSYNDETSSIIEEVREKFRRIRDNPMDERATLFITTTSGQIWGMEKPCKVVAQRILDLANAATACADNVMDKEIAEFKSLFITPMNDYDVLIFLDPTNCPRYYQNVSVEKRSLLKQMISKDWSKNRSHAEKNKWIGFDPVEWYMDELRGLYSNVALFFHDKYGGNIIGVVWKPVFFTPRPWKVNLGFSSMMVSSKNTKEKDEIPSDDNKDNQDSNLVILNSRAVALEMERLGQDLVTKIDIRK
ncbi:10809_t:CDS:10 [Acaulospora colombiana]|uniref:10809_t:CDS:1 n=1 Tax=Acaulospora colombiana TaxID=27376 RepID=A0ACA9KEM9_9GLOM|nr:10809_t:CDS:10 [Acaulospora colombiana]